MTTTKKKYEVFHPDHEAMVHFLQNMKKAINSENFAELFEKAGINDKRSDEWIPMQILLDIFNELEKQGGANLDFVAIGMRSIMDGEYPAEFMELPFDQKVASAGAQYPFFMRGTNVGYIKDLLIAPQHIAYHVNAPSPD